MRPERLQRLEEMVAELSRARPPDSTAAEPSLPTTVDREVRLEEIAEEPSSSLSQVSTETEPLERTSIDLEISCPNSQIEAQAKPGAEIAEPEFSTVAPNAEGETRNETALTDEPESALAGLSGRLTIHLRWVLRDINARRTKMSPVSPDDLSWLIELGLVEVRDEVPVLTNEGRRSIGAEGEEMTKP